jgi:acyl carrier protein
VNRAAVRLLIVEWLDDNFHFGEAESLLINDDISWLDNGVLTSLGFVELILYLEDTLRVELPRDTLTRENFDGMNKILNRLELIGARYDG